MKKYNIGGWIIVIATMVFALWYLFNPKHDGMWYFNRYCPQCEHRFTMRQDVYKTCPECGYMLFKSQDELTNGDQY